MILTKLENRLTHFSVSSVRINSTTSKKKWTRSIKFFGLFPSAVQLPLFVFIFSLHIYNSRQHQQRTCFVFFLVFGIWKQQQRQQQNGKKPSENVCVLLRPVFSILEIDCFSICFRFQFFTFWKFLIIKWTYLVVVVVIELVILISRFWINRNVYRNQNCYGMNTHKQNALSIEAATARFRSNCFFFSQKTAIKNAK